MILNFLDFLTENINENYLDHIPPIPEINEKNKLGVILLGLPGAGKSTFARHHIPRDIKKFSTDDVSLEFTKDPKKHYPGASDINIERLKKQIESGNNFIYDTTGVDEVKTELIYSKAKESGYKVIFILVLIDISTAKMQNKRRSRMGGHMADEDFIEQVYGKQLETTKKYLKLRPDGFYLALSVSYQTPIHEFPRIKYRFMKFDSNGELMFRRKNRYEYK